MMDPNVCPVCTLYLREGITLHSHLNTHPKDQVIEALVRCASLGVPSSIANESGESVSDHLSAAHSGIETPSTSIHHYGNPVQPIPTVPSTGPVSVSSPYGIGGPLNLSSTLSSHNGLGTPNAPPIHPFAIGLGSAGNQYASTFAYQQYCGGGDGTLGGGPLLLAMSPQQQYAAYSSSSSSSSNSVLQMVFNPYAVDPVIGNPGYAAPGLITGIGLGPTLQTCQQVQTNVLQQVVTASPLVATSMTPVNPDIPTERNEGDSISEGTCMVCPDTKESEVVEIPEDQITRTNSRQRSQNMDDSLPVQDLDGLQSSPAPSSSHVVPDKDPLEDEEESTNKQSYPLRRSMRRARSRSKHMSKSCSSKEHQIESSGNQNQPASSSSSSSLLASDPLSSVRCGRGSSRKGSGKSLKTKLKPERILIAEQVYCEGSPKQVYCEGSPKQVYCEGSPKQMYCEGSPKQVYCEGSPKQVYCGGSPTNEGMIGCDSDHAYRSPSVGSGKQDQEQDSEEIIDVDDSLVGSSQYEACRSEIPIQTEEPERVSSKVEGQDEWVDISMFPAGAVVAQDEHDGREDAVDDSYQSEEYLEHETTRQNENLNGSQILNEEREVFLVNQWSLGEDNQRCDGSHSASDVESRNQEKDCREVVFKDPKETEYCEENLSEDKPGKEKELLEGVDLKVQKCFTQEAAEPTSLDSNGEGSEVQRHMQQSSTAIEDDEVIVVGRGENATLEPEKDCRSRAEGDGHREGSPAETAVCLRPAPGDTEDALPAPPSPVNIFQIDGMSIILSSRLIEQTDKMRERLGIFEGIGPVAGSFSDISIPEGILEEEGLVSDIRADEAMPPRGELSGQEGMGSASNYSDPGIVEDAVPKPEGTTIWTSGGFSLFPASARQGATQADPAPGTGETWTNGSPFKGSQESNIGSAAPETTTTKKRQRKEKKDASTETVSKASSNTSKTKTKRLYHCWNCLEVFNCPKERRVHQREKHNGEKSVGMTPEIDSAIAPMDPVQVKEQDGLSGLNPPLVKSEEKDDKSAVREAVEKEKSKVGVNAKGDKAEVANVEAAHPCSDCDRSFPSLRSLTAHRRAAHRDSRYKCPTCMEKFLTSADFTNHVRTVHPLECSMCGKQFSRQQNLRLHLKRHLSVRPYKCTQCDKAFVTNQKMEEHLNSHTGRTPFQCPLCPRAFRRHSNLIQHRKHHHMKVKRKVRDFFCHCGAVFHSVKKLEWHKETHEEKPKTCPHCSDRFVHKAGLTRHIRQVHDKRYVPSGAREDVNVECPVCSAVYLKSSLHIHMRVHSGERPFSCGICGKGFATKWNLQLHRWVHASPHSKPFKCATCKAAYHRRVDYVAHIRSHRKVRPYVCNTCGRRFMRKYNCVRHSREHETGKKFECSICHKRFHRRYYLKEHLRIHTGLRPYVCHVCGKASGTKSNMNKHVRIHHAREPVNTEG